ncbi:MAG: hypothetical protein JWQ98_3073 [Chlorobi bacterium]|nr:hypothetical protein [Chlorobiota bacterium]
MRKALATIMLLGLITSSAFAATQSFYQAVTCSNGYGGAYIVTVINTDFGALISSSASAVTEIRGIRFSRSLPALPTSGIPITTCIQAMTLRGIPGM